MRLIGRAIQLVSLSLMVAACGRKGALLYPDMLVPAAPTVIAAQQSGSTVKLQFTLPDKDRAGRSLKGITGVKISRRTAETDPKGACRSCMADYQLVSTQYLDHLPAATQRFGNRLILIDSDVVAGNYYSYNVVPFTADGVDGASATSVDAHVYSPMSAPVLKAESSPGEIVLHMDIQPPVVGRLLGFNLYRTSGAGARPFQPLNREPLKGNEFVDSALNRGVRYHYSARILVAQPTGVVLESAESNEVEGMLKDDE
ncbi:MAG: hypothetical protein WCI45_07080, partial [Desulfuromonadales bacterium]